MNPNILNDYYNSYLGGPSVGGFYYLTVSYKESTDWIHYLQFIVDYTSQLRLKFVFILWINYSSVGSHEYFTLSIYK